MGGSGAAGAPDAGAPQQVGTYSYRARDRCWTWSEEVFRIHGFEPGEVVPTTELLLAHKHPDDLARAAEVLARAMQDGAPYSCRHRVIDVSGREHTVLVVGRGTLRDGQVVELRGYVVDVTQEVEQDVRERADAAVRAAREHQGPLEQAKGALMLALGVDSDVAFALLSAKSQVTNVKVHRVAEELMTQVVDGGLESSSAEAVTDWLCADAIALLTSQEARQEA